MAEYTFNTVSIPIGGDTPEAQYLDDRIERARQRFFDKHGPEIHALVMRVDREVEMRMIYGSDWDGEIGGDPREQYVYCEG